MKHLNITIVIAAAVLSSFFSSCSNDDAPVVIRPSRVIEQVKVYKGKADEFKLVTVMKFEYSWPSGKISLIESASPFSQVTYRYENDAKFSYTHAYKLADGSDKVNIVSSTLVNGRINICSSKLLGNCVYTYNESTGLLSQASVGNDIILNYKWLNTELDLEASSSTDPLVEPVYSTVYHFSGVPNNYSVDLTVFPQLIDERDQYSLIMNSYAQAAGVLGKKFDVVMEAKGYVYSYGFDKNGRLAQLTITPDIYGETYNFVFLFRENQ